MGTETTHHVAVEDVNRIVLEGRLSRDPEIKVLESGDRLVLLRVVTARPVGSRVDSIPVAVGPSARRGKRRQPGQARARDVDRAARLASDDRVRVEGFLERRFWQVGPTRRSRLQVVAETITRA